VSGADYLAITLLAGFVIITLVVDWARERIARHRREGYEAEEHRQLMRELRRQP
jgi:hypothetical protein